MLLDIIIDIVVLLFAVGAVLYLGNYIWFQNYSQTLLSIVYIIFVVGAGALLSIPNFVKGVGKSLLVVLSILLLTVVYTLTVIVPLVGGRTQPLAERLDSWVYSSNWVGRGKEIRGAMIATAAKKDDRELEFEDPNDYRDALSEVKEESKRRLERGETVLSIILGLALLLAPLLNVQIFQVRLFGFNATLWVEIYLMAITVSIMYRVTILDVLTFSEDAEFDSMKEMDIALSYQRMVSLVDALQGLVVVLYISYALSNAKYEAFRLALEKRYVDNMGFLRMIFFLWNNRKQVMN